MITFLWVIGIISVSLGAVCSLIADSPSAFRSYHSWDKAALVTLLLGLFWIGTATYLTGPEHKNTSTNIPSCMGK